MIRLTLFSLAVWALIVLSAYAVFAHDMYRDLKNAVGTECCDDHDCQPVEECSSPGDMDVRVVINGNCIAVPPEAVLGFYSPDGLTHACLCEEQHRAERAVRYPAWEILMTCILCSRSADHADAPGSS